MQSQKVILNDGNQQEPKTSINSQSRKLKKIKEISSISDLTYPNLILSDMNKFDLSVIGYEDKLFKHVAYQIQVKISDIPPFIVLKRYNEFRALYKALNLRFQNITWPDFPSKLQIIQKLERRKKAFQDLLQKLVEIARGDPKVRKYILGIFYAFMFGESGTLDPQKINTYVPNNNENRKSAARSSVSTVKSKGDEDSDGEGDQAQLQKLLLLSDNCENYDEPIFEKEDNLRLSERGPNKNRRLSFTDYTRSARYQNIIEYPKTIDRAKTRKISDDFSFDDEVQVNVHKNFASKLGKAIEKIGEETSPQLNGLIDDSKSTTLTDISSRKSLKMLSNDEKSMNRCDDIIDFIQHELKTDLSEMKKNIGSATKNIKLVSIIKKKMKYGFFKQKKITDNDCDDIHENKNKLFDILKDINLDDIVTDNKKKENINWNNKLRDMLINSQIIEEKFSYEDIKELELPNFSSDIWIRFETGEKWQKYHGRFMDSYLLLHKSVYENSPSITIPCYLSNIHYYIKEDAEYLELYHFLDHEKLYLSPDPYKKTYERKERRRQILIWYSQMKVASRKALGLDFDGMIYCPMGKVDLQIIEVTNVKGINNSTICFVRASHTPFILNTKKYVYKDTAIPFNQKFYLPLCDHFIPIKLELLCAYNDGWIKENHKEEVICFAEIGVVEIVSLSQSSSLSLSLKMEYTEARKKALLKSQNAESFPTMKLRIRNMSSFKSFFSCSPPMYVEGRKVDTHKFTTNHLKVSFFRVRRITSYIWLLVTRIQAMFHFKYPLFSFYCLWFMIIFALKFNMDHISQFMLIILISLMIYHHPACSSKLDKFLEDTFFKESDLNPFYKKPNVYSITETDVQKSLNPKKFTKNVELGEDKGIYQTYKNFQKSMALLDLVLTQISNFFEKCKNIAMWEDRYRSIIFMISIIFAYIIIEIFSMRVLIIISICDKFYCGLKYYKVLYPKNKELVTKAFYHVIKKEIPDLLPQLQNLSMIWPSSASNWKKIIDQLGYILKIQIPEKLINENKTPEELITSISTCDSLLTSTVEFDDDIILKERRMKQFKFNSETLKNFIVNIPSDYYRVLHPKMN